MNGVRRGKLPTSGAGRWLVGSVLAAGAIWGMSVVARAQYPVGPQILKDGTVVLLQDYASLPLSSWTTGSYPPPINFAEQLGRGTVMRSEPSGAPRSSARFFVADQDRHLYILDKASRAFTSYINFELVFQKLLNSGMALGLIAFQFDPDYANNGVFYTVHSEDPLKTGSTTPTNAGLPGLDLSGGYTSTTASVPPTGTVVAHAVLVEWTDAAINDSTFQGTAREVLRIAFNGNGHLIADLIFNPLAQPGHPDYRNLYVSTGDGFAGASTSSNKHYTPQRLDALQGKILRITPDASLRPGDALGSNGRYRIPTTGADPNPVFSITYGSAKREIYAYGFRNPHRMHWDSISNTLLVNVIGEHAWEEVELLTKGANYGWAEREGIEQIFIGGANHGKTGSQTSPPTPIPSPDTIAAGPPTPVTPVYPVIAYSHHEGDAISNGFVYSGTLLPQLHGRYVFGDLTTARLFYADLADMILSHDGNRLTVAAVHELQVVFSSPYNGLGAVNRRLYDIVADEYAHKGGDPNSGSALGVLPGHATNVGGWLSGIFNPGRTDVAGAPYAGGRADIRLAQGADGEIYVLSKSDGMIRALLPTTPPPPVAPEITAQPQSVTTSAGATVAFSVGASGTAPLSYQWRKGGLDIASATGSTLTLSNVQTADTGGSYDVVVRNAGGAATSNLVTLTVNTSPPASPTGLTATAGHSQVVLGWVAAGGATSYNVKRSTTSGGPYTTVASVTAGTHTNTGLTNGTTYYFVVSAVNGGGESGNSTQVSARPSAPVVAFTSASSTGDEGSTPATLAVQLSAPSGQTVTVNYAVTGGSATGGGVDVTLPAGTLTFVPGDVAKNVSLTVVNDLLVEAAETVVVTLSAPSNATLGAPVVHTYTILDNDVANAARIVIRKDTSPDGSPAEFSFTASYLPAPAVPSFRARTTRTGTSTQATFDKPAGTVAGDVLVVFLTWSNSINLLSGGAPAGWAQIGGGLVAGATAFQAWYHVVTAADSGTPSWGWNLTSSIAWLTIGGAYVGVNTTANAVVDGFSTAVLSNGTSISAPSIPLTAVNDVLVLFDDVNGSGTFTQPAGFTERYEGNGQTMADRVFAAAGASGAQRSTMNVTGKLKATWLVALRRNGNFVLKDGQARDSGTLAPGTYSVSEMTPTGWNLTSATCSDGSPVSAISLQAGETVTCTFFTTAP
jgi:hypothetical protein